MKRPPTTLNPDLLEFWKEHARPGRIGLIHLDFAPARLINWGQKWATRDGKPSRWVHTFLFLEPRDGMPWIVESDVRIPLPGFVQNKPDGPQTAPVSKWSSVLVDDAAVLEPNLTSEQYRTAARRGTELCAAGYRYPRLSMVDTWLALVRHDLSHRGLLASDRTMHCSQLVRECLMAAGADPFDAKALSKNVAPEHLAQIYPLVAAWTPRPVVGAKATIA